MEGGKDKIMTDEQKKIEINKAITRAYPKMVADANRICGYNADRWADDLLSHCLTDFITKKKIDYQYKVAVKDNKLPNYMGLAMSQQVRSGTSTFYNTYRKFLYGTRGVYEAEYNQNAEYYDDPKLMELPQESNPIDCIEWALEQLHPYERTLLRKKYYEGWTWNDIRDYYGLPTNSANRDVKKAYKKIKELCNQFS